LARPARGCNDPASQSPNVRRFRWTAAAARGIRDARRPRQTDNKNMAAPTLRAQNIPLGIGLMIGSILIFSANDALGKWLAAGYPAPQMMLFRSAPALALLTPFIGRYGWRAFVFLDRPWLQAARALMGALETLLFYWAVRRLPLADAMTYYLAGPIYVTVMASLFLREKVGWRRWTAVLVGFVGVLIALGPSAASFGLPAFVALLGSFMYSAFLVATRLLRGTPDTVMAAWQVASGLIIGLIGTPFVWTPLQHWYDGLLLGLLGVVALFAIVGINRSLAVAPASIVVPYQYTIIIWAAVFGYVVFGNAPTVNMLAGAAIIVCAGLFIFFREQQVGLPAAQEIAPER
jgi:drug/metabolite transporter (DMT)-like permease